MEEVERDGDLGRSETDVENHIPVNLPVALPVRNMATRMDETRDIALGLGEQGLEGWQQRLGV